MSSNRFKLEGLPELREALRNLPEALAREGGDIVTDTGIRASRAIRDVYHAHRDSGELEDSLVVTASSVSYGSAVEIRVKSSAAWWFDNGTQARHWLTDPKHGTGKMFSKSAPTHVFLGTMMRERRVMYQELAELIESHGLTVTRDASR